MRISDWSSDVCSSDLTARSRNDQVATDFRLWVRDAIDEVEAGLQGLSDMLLTRAEEHADAVMPGFTHLQSAQPVTLGHHRLAYHEIGRASGREQVCQYVEILGVAVSLQKNNTS